MLIFGRAHAMQTDSYDPARLSEQAGGRCFVDHHPIAMVVFSRRRGLLAEVEQHPVVDVADVVESSDVAHCCCALGCGWRRQRYLGSVNAAVAGFAGFAGTELPARRGTWRVATLGWWTTGACRLEIS